MSLKNKILLIGVFAMFYCCSEIVRVEDISEDTVNILAPTNNAILNTTDVSFNWQDLEDAEEYNIQIANPNFSEALQIVVDTTVTTSSLSKTLYVGSFEWRVKALNSSYETDYTTQSFTIE